MTWAELAQRMLGAFLLVAVAMLFMTQGARATVRHALLFILIAMVVLKLGIDLPEALRRAARARSQGGGIARCLRVLVPPEWAALARLEHAWLRGFFHWLIRRPVQRPIAAGRGAAFTFTKRSSYQTIIILVLIMLVTEVPVSIVVLNALKLDPQLATKIHLIMGDIGIIALASLIGDRWCTNGGAHVLSGSAIKLRMGVRSCGTVPLRFIHECRQLERNDPIVRARLPMNRGEVVRVTPVDRPNVAILLRPESTVRLKHMQLVRTNLRQVLVYVDDPALFVRRINDSLRREEGF